MTLPPPNGKYERFHAHLSKNSRAECRRIGCGIKIKKGTLRIAAVYTKEVSFKDGHSEEKEHTRYYHIGLYLFSL